MTRMKIAGIAGALVVGCLLAGPALADGDMSNGWLEGIVRESNGLPTRGIVQIVILKDGNSITTGLVQTALGGLYTFRGLKPDTYEVQVLLGGRPERIWGVMVKPGVRSHMDIKLVPGVELLEIGKPPLVTEPVVVVSEEIARLQAENAAMEAQVERLKKTVRDAGLKVASARR